MSELKKRILNDVKIAMKAGEKERLATLRLITAAIKQREVDERIELDDEQVILTLDKMVKQRRESIAQYDAAGRDDLSAIEQAELPVIQGFMPTPLSDSEIEALISDAISHSGAAGMKDMGKVMGILKPKMQGRADMSAVSSKIRSVLTTS
jgi:uncharacterized protein YqeY